MTTIAGRIFRSGRAATLVAALLVSGAVAAAAPPSAFAEKSEKEAVKELCELDGGTFEEDDGIYRCKLDGGGGCYWETNEPGGRRGNNGRADGPATGGECWDQDGNTTQTFHEGSHATGGIDLASVPDLLGPIHRR